MKRILLAVSFAVIAFASNAQSKSVAGKWKLTTLSSEGVMFNVDDPAQMKTELKKQFEASGAAADSAMVEMVFNSIFSALSNMTFDFGANGKLIVNTAAEDGKAKKEEEDYTVDYAKGLIVSKSKEKAQNILFKFESDNLILTVEDQPGKTSVLTLKKIK